MGKLDGKVAIVTGASRGIGSTIAQLFAAEGARVVITARTEEEGQHSLPGSLAGTLARIRRAGGEAVSVAANVASFESCQHVVAEANSVFGPVDILVNNAAIAWFKSSMRLKPNQFATTFAVDVNGPFFMSQLCLPDMIQRRAGCIINISSSAAVGPGCGPYSSRMDGTTCYGAAKAALERLTQGLAEEMWPHNVTVACYAPAQLVPTPGAGANTRDIDALETEEVMARAALLIATLPCEKITGRVGYSQALLKEFGWASEARGVGSDVPGSGFSIAGQHKGRL